MEPDGTFPNHEANPIKEENLDDAVKLPMAKGAALGVAPTAPPRCCFVDEDGGLGATDLMTALLASEFPHGSPVVSTCSRSGQGGDPASRGASLTRTASATASSRRPCASTARLCKRAAGHTTCRRHLDCGLGACWRWCRIALNLVARAENQGVGMSELVEDLRRYHATGHQLRGGGQGGRARPLHERFRTGARTPQ